MRVDKYINTVDLETERASAAAGNVLEHGFDGDRLVLNSIAILADAVDAVADHIELELVFDRRDQLLD